MRYQFALISTLALTQLPAQRPYRPGVDVLDYALTIDLPDTGRVIKGDAMITVRRTMRVDTLTLDLRTLQVDRVRVNRRLVTFARTDSTLRIPLPRTPGDTTTFVIDVSYGGPVDDGLIARKDSAGRWTYFGDNWPNRARYWIPSVDHPSDKATVTMTVLAPASETVIANGSLMESRTTGSGRRARVLSRWRESEPIAPYLIVIAAAPLVERDLGETACGHADLQRCVPQAVFTAPEQRAVVPGPYGRAGDIVDFFATLVAPFPYEKLYHFQSATRFGGMENATAIFYADGMFRHNRLNEGVIAHETAHQWFGDAVTEIDWPHLWLSEGFASYFDALWTQHAHGDSAFKAQMARARVQILADTTAVAHRPVIDTIETNLLALLNTNSYQKGAWVLHMLRSELGDKDFFGGVRAYYLAHKNGNATSDDLRSALERASGRDLRAFFDQWLRRPGYPELSLAWAQDTTSQRVNLTVTQTGRFGFFDFPFAVAFTDSGGQRRTYEIRVPAQATSVIGIGYTGGPIMRVDLDPDVRLLARFVSRDST